MIVHAKTDIGMQRKMNQDAYCISQDNEEYVLCVLADGMGGYTGGEIASNLAAMSVDRYIKENFDKNKEYNKEELQELIERSIEYANKIVYEKSRKDEELEQMGTTLEICLIYNNRVFIGHIGDSRIYRIRQDIMRKITTDHSYVQNLVKEGKITKEEAVNHPKKNMLMKALGCELEVEPDVTVKNFQKDDIILICSDGLTNMVDEKEIYNIIRKDFDNAANNLINKANELGGRDNITVILIKN